MIRALKQKKVGGFTLIELIMVIVILGILAAIAIPKLFDFSGDAKRATALGVLGAVRTAVALYFSKNALPPPTGGNRPWWPNFTQLTSADSGPGVVMESKMADNPFSENGNSASRNNVDSVNLASDALLAQKIPLIPINNTGAWAYDSKADGIPSLPEGQPYPQPGQGADVGQFWANTTTLGFGEASF